MRFQFSAAVVLAIWCAGASPLPAQEYLKQLEETILKRQGESKGKSESTADDGAMPGKSGSGEGLILGGVPNETLPPPSDLSIDDGPMLLSPPSLNNKSEALPAPRGTAANPSGTKGASSGSKTGNHSLLKGSDVQAPPPPRPMPPRANGANTSSSKAIAGRGGYLGMTVESGQGGGFGLLVAQVTPDSPAWKAGFRVGDRLIGVDGSAVSTVDEFAIQLGQFNPGNPIRFLVDRKGRNTTLTAVLMDRSLANRVHGNVPGAIPYQPVGAGDAGDAYLGVDVSDMSDEFRKQFGIGTYRGASVTEVIKDSPADQAGLKPGDCIITFKGREVRGADDVLLGIVESRPGELVDISFYRGSILHRGSTVLINKSAAPLPQGEMAENAIGVTPDMLTPEYVQALHSELDRMNGELQTAQERLQQLEARLKQIESRR